MRDPEVEFPEDAVESPTDAKLESKPPSTKLERMHDGSQSDEGDSEVDITPLITTKKRKYTPTEEEIAQEDQRRKKPASPRTFSPLRGNG
jgi:hypothetical protein